MVHLTVDNCRVSDFADSVARWSVTYTHIHAHTYIVGFRLFRLTMVLTD